MVVKVARKFHSHRVLLGGGEGGGDSSPSPRLLLDVPCHSDSSLWVAQFLQSLVPGLDKEHLDPRLDLGSADSGIGLVSLCFPRLCTVPSLEFLFSE